MPMPSICTTMKPSSASACVAGDRAERLGHEGALRPGVDLLDHRVLLGRIEIGGPDDDAPDIGLAVAALGDEDFGASAARGEQRRGVAFSRSITTLRSSVRRSCATGGRSTRDQVST